MSQQKPANLSSKSEHHFRCKAEDQGSGDGGGGDADETRTKGSRSVRRRTQETHEEDSNEGLAKLKDQHESSHLGKNMREYDEANTQKLMEQQLAKEEQDDPTERSQHVNKDESLYLSEDELDSQDGYISPEYCPTSEVIYPYPYVVPLSPSTTQEDIENVRREHMTTANQALKYYHQNHPGDTYEAIHVNLRRVIYMIETTGHYIHMNFEARNMTNKVENIFFAELFSPWDGDTEYAVTACDMVCSESLGGLSNVHCPNGFKFSWDSKDEKNCYACHDAVKHIEGTMYQAGHMGHSAYDINDITVE